MDTKSIIFGLILGIAAASLVWGLVLAELQIKKEKSEDSWYRDCMRILDSKERACDRFVDMIRRGDKKDISDEEVYRIKNFE